jgi:DNA-binding NarL/FixJ family response regulator
VADRKRKPPRLRVAFVRTPPLLIDVIQRVLSSRLGMVVVAEIAEIEAAPNTLPKLAPDVVIVGPNGNARQINALMRRLLPATRVFALSADLLELLGPGDEDVTELTLETLAQRLRN